jgi:amino acid transporter
VVLVNVLGTAFGGMVQVAGTVLKVGGVLTLIVLPFVVGGGSTSNLSPVWPAHVDGSIVSGMMVAMVGVLWAYDGWMNLTPLAEEVRDPGRNIPRALGLGMATLIGLYLAVTLAYHAVLSISEVAASGKSAGQTVSAKFCGVLLGRGGVIALSGLVMCSTFISLNGNALTGPRTYFAMARDRLFFSGLSRIHPRFGTPANAVLAQGAWAIGLIVAGTLMILWPAPGPESGLPGPLLAAWRTLNGTPLYKLLYTYVVFGANLFYLLAIASVFVLRVRRPDAPRPYRTWGYPFTPLLFVVAALYLLADMLRQSPIESLAGVGIILSGVPAFLIFRPNPRASSTGD